MKEANPQPGPGFKNATPQAGPLGNKKLIPTGWELLLYMKLVPYVGASGFRQLLLLK